VVEEERRNQAVGDAAQEIEDMDREGVQEAQMEEQSFAGGKQSCPCKAVADRNYTIHCGKVAGKVL